MADEQTDNQDVSSQATAPSPEQPVATPPAAQESAPAETPAQSDSAQTTGSQGAPAAAASAPAPKGGGSRGSRGGGAGGRGRGGPQRGGRGGRSREREPDESGIESSVVRIYRCSKVVKGGRTFSFGALVVAGNRHGEVGIGYGKANEVPPAVEKATKDARKSMFRVHLKGTTVPHMVRGISGASTVVLVPARPGTGVTAGKSVRPVLELVGLSDVLTKAYGSTSAKNLVKATVDALRQLQNRQDVEKRRGVELPQDAGELVTA